MSSFRTFVGVELRNSGRSQRSFGALVVLAIAVVLICNGVIGAGVARFADSIRYQSALNLIEVSSAFAGAEPTPITDTSLIAVSDLDGVEAVHPWIQIDLELGDQALWPDASVNPGAFWGTPLVPGLEPDLVAGYLPEGGLGPGEILLPDAALGGSTSELLNQEVVFNYTRVVSAGRGEGAQTSFTVVGLFDNSVIDRDGPQAAYLGLDEIVELVQVSGRQSGELEYPRAFAEAVDSETVVSVQTELANEGFAVSSVAAQLRELGGLFRVLSWAEDGLRFLLAIVSLAIGGALGSAWVTQRKREIGVLRALGWSSRSIASALAAVAVLAGLAISLVGTLLGVVGAVVASGLVASLDLPLLQVNAWTPPSLISVLFAIVLPPICLLLGGSFGVFRAVRLEPDEALRDYG